jgi:hypothetical protein
VACTGGLGGAGDGVRFGDGVGDFGAGERDGAGADGEAAAVGTGTGEGEVAVAAAAALRTPGYIRRAGTSSGRRRRDAEWTISCQFTFGIGVGVGRVAPFRAARSFAASSRCLSPVLSVP